MAGSGAVGLATALTSLGSAQAAVSAQASLQRGVLDLQQQLVEQLLGQLLAGLGQGVNLNVIA